VGQGGGRLSNWGVIRKTMKRVVRGDRELLAVSGEKAKVDQAGGKKRKRERSKAGVATGEGGFRCGGGGDTARLVDKTVEKKRQETRGGAPLPGKTWATNHSHQKRNYGHWYLETPQKPKNRCKSRHVCEGGRANMDTERVRSGRSELDHIKSRAGILIR